MCRIVLLLLSIAAVIPVVSAQTVPIKVGFKMVKCDIFNARRCARTTMTMDKETYQMLGKPRFAQFTYYRAKLGEVHEKVDLTREITGDIDMKINGSYALDFGLYGNHYFTLNKVCLDNSCQNTEIDTSNALNYTCKTLHFSAPGAMDELPVKVGFRKTQKCEQEWISGRKHCDPILPQASINMSSESYQALGSPSQVSFNYYRRLRPTILRIKFVPDDDGGMFFIKTDIVYSSSPSEHFYFVLNKMCLEHVGCVNTHIVDGSSSGDYIDDTLYFNVP